MIPRLVVFKCCGDEKVFTYQGEFRMCKCGSSGYDAGDGHYCRILGKREDVHITTMFNQICVDAIKERGLTPNLNDKGQVVVVPGAGLLLTCEHPGKFVLEIEGDKAISFSTIKSALARSRKLSRSV